MALTAADVARMSPAAQKQIAAKLVGEAQRKLKKKLMLEKFNITVKEV